MRKEKYIKQQKRSTGYYFVVQFYYYLGSERKQYSKTFKSNDYQTVNDCLNDACDHRDLMRSKLIRGQMVDSFSMTVQDAFNEFDSVYKYKQSTYDKYYYKYENWIKKDYGSIKIKDLTPYEISMCLSNAVHDLSDHSLIFLLGVWKKIFKIARLHQPALNDITDLVTVPKSLKVHKPKDVGLNDKDLTLLVDHLLTTGSKDNTRYDNKILAYALMIMRYTGMRPQEVFALKRDNITDVIKIREAISKDKQGYSPQNVKTKSAIRDIPISNKCRYYLDLAMDLSKDSYFMTDYFGNFANIRAISSYVSKVSRSLNIHVTMYDLRHQLATDLITANVDPRTVQEIMGHTSATMSIYYARSNDELKKKVLDTI